jgi:hypothetical protein
VDKSTQKVSWVNTKTLQESFEHPGIQVFKVNHRVLQAKAEEELRD